MQVDVDVPVMVVDVKATLLEQLEEHVLVVIPCRSKETFICCTDARYLTACTGALRFNSLLLAPLTSSDMACKQYGGEDECSVAR